MYHCDAQTGSLGPALKTAHTFWGRYKSSCVG